MEVVAKHDFVPNLCRDYYLSCQRHGRWTIPYTKLSGDKLLAAKTFLKRQSFVPKLTNVCLLVLVEIVFKNLAPKRWAFPLMFLILCLQKNEKHPLCDWCLCAIQTL